MKKAIVLMHGWLSDKSDYDSIISELEKRYNHIEIITYPGHSGDDPYNFSEEGTFEVIHNAFKDVQSKYQIIDVMGFSLGGALASYLSQKFAFNKLVLLAPANRYFNFGFTFSKIRFLTSSIYNLEKARRAKDKEEEKYYKQIIKGSFEDDKIGLSFLKENYLQRYFTSSFKTFRRVIKRVNKEKIIIKNPLFIAWGKLDQLVPKNSPEELFENAISQEKIFKVYDNLSHTMIMGPNNKILVNDILRFLDN